MSKTVAELTVEDLRELIGEVVAEKIRELVEDREDDLDFSDELTARLLEQRRGVASGSRGLSLDEVAARLGLD